MNLPSQFKDIGKQINVDAIGKSAGLTPQQTAALAKQIGRERINVLARYAVNPKSQGLTKSFLVKLGLGLGATGLAVGAIGTYPFAGFIKEEALQTLGFAFNTAERNNDIEGMELALENVQVILDAAPSIMEQIPYANVLKQLKTFFLATETKLEVDKKRLETLRGEQEAGESEFSKQRRESDETAIERKREFGEEETERFEGIEEERQQRAIDEQKLDIKKSRVFQLRREGKFDEADELEQEILRELEGGN